MITFAKLFTTFFKNNSIPYDCEAHAICPYDTFDCIIEWVADMKLVPPTIKFDVELMEPSHRL